MTQDLAEYAGHRGETLTSISEDSMSDLLSGARANMLECNNRMSECVGRSFERVF